MKNELNELAEQFAYNIRDIDLETNANMVFIERFQKELENNGISKENAEFYASYLLSDLSGLSIDDSNIDTAVSSFAKTYAKIAADIDTFWRNKAVSSENVKIRVVTAIKAMTLTF